jgi:chromosome segregation ATPase
MWIGEITASVRELARNLDALRAELVDQGKAGSGQREQIFTLFEAKKAVDDRLMKISEDISRILQNCANRQHMGDDLSEGMKELKKVSDGLGEIRASRKAEDEIARKADEAHEGLTGLNQKLSGYDGLVTTVTAQGQKIVAIQTKVMIIGATAGVLGATIGTLLVELILKACGAK